MTRRPRPRLEPGDRRHGTYNGYVNHGCRCPACTDAHTDWARARRHQRGTHRPLAEHLAALAARPVTHGIRATYTNGCRCDDCRDAERRYKADYRRRRAVS